MKSTMFFGAKQLSFDKERRAENALPYKQKRGFCAPPRLWWIYLRRKPYTPRGISRGLWRPAPRPARPAPRRKAPPAPRSPGARRRKAAPDAAPPDLGPVWRHVRAAGPRGPVFAWRPPRPPRGPCAPEKSPLPPGARPRHPPPRYPPGCARAALFSPAPAPPGAARRAPARLCLQRRPSPRPRPAAAAAPRARRPPPPSRAAPGAFESLGAVPRDRGPLSRKFPRKIFGGGGVAPSQQPAPLRKDG